MQDILNELNSLNIDEYGIYIILGIAVLVIGAIVISGSKNKSKKPTKKSSKKKIEENEDEDEEISLKKKKKKNIKVTHSSSNETSLKNGEKAVSQSKQELSKELRAELKELDKRRMAQKKLPKSVQQSIPYIAEYDNGVLELKKLKDGKSKYSIAFKFDDMNYSTLKPEEAKTIFLRYVDLINALPTDCDAFLVVDNQNIDIESLKKSIYINDRKDEFNALRHEYNDILENNILSGNNQLHKERYFIITITANNQLEAFSTFTRLEGEVTNAFKRIGTVAKRMSTMERFELLHDKYKPDCIGQFKKMKLSYKKLEKHLISMKDYICPDSFDFKTNYFMFGEKYGRVVFINDYPSVMSDRFLGELADVKFNVTVNLTIHPIKMDVGIKMIKKQILGMESNKQEAQKNAMKNGFDPNMINHNLKTALEDAEGLLDDVQNNNQKLYEVTYVIMHTADSLGELDTDTETLMSIASKYLCQIRTLPHQQEQGLNQVMPFGNNILNLAHTLTTESTAVFMPFIAQELMQTNGFYYGMNAVSGNLVYFNRLNLMNANGFTLGASGSGKSFSNKREMTNILLNTDDEVIVIDPDGEYVPFLKGMGGEHIIVSPTSTNYINPMDMDKDYNITDDGKVGDPVIAKSDFIISLCEEALGYSDMGISPVQRAFIDGCVRETYKEYLEHNFDKAYQPTFKDLQKQFDEQMSNKEEEDIAKAFSLYSNGSLNVFANQTNVNINKRFVGFDISQLGKSLNTMGQLIMLDAVWNHVLQNRAKGIRTWLYVDEFTVLLRKESSKVFFLDTFKRIRKMGGACTGITQNITSLFRDEDAMEMLSNAEFIYLLNQSAPDRIQLQNILGLSDTQLEYVSDVDKGCGIIKAGRHIIPFKDQFPKDNTLYEMMTTDPDERKKIDNLDGKRNGELNKEAI